MLSKANSELTATLEDATKVHQSKYAELEQKHLELSASFHGTYTNYRLLIARNGICYDESQ